MKYLRYGSVFVAVVLTIIARQVWIPKQAEPAQSYRPIIPKTDDYIEYEIELLGGESEEAAAEYVATYIPRGRDKNGSDYVKLLDGDLIELSDKYTVINLLPVKMEEGRFVIFSSIYLEDSAGRRERSAPSVTTGLPAFDPLTGIGYLAFDTRAMQGDLKLIITYAVDPGRDTAYGPAFAEVAIK